MRNIARVLTLILAVALLFGLCACSAGSGDSGKNGESASSSKAIELCKSDEAYLKEQKYTTFVYSSYLDSYAAKLAVDVSELVRVTKAYNDDGDEMMIYYFKTEDMAKACYDKNPADFKVVGLRLVSGDPQNVIK